MSESFDLPSVDRLTTGTVGPPGERVFYLQARAGAQVVTLKLEKTQVAALAAHLAERLTDLPTADTGAAPGDVELGLEQPVEPAWVVGALGVTYDEQLDRLLLIAEELVPDDEPEPPAPAVARFGATRAQVAAFVEHAAEVVAKGRPPCPLCGRPLDQSGHACVKSNGHRTR